MTETQIQNQIRIALSNYGICVRLNTGYFKTDGLDIQELHGLTEMIPAMIASILSNMEKAGTEHEKD